MEYSKAEIERLVRAALQKPRGRMDSQQEIPMIPVGISNRHVHLSACHLEQLFGRGYHLNRQKDLSQPGQYAAAECVALVGPKGTIGGVRVLGPARDVSQVEILQSDARRLGINGVVRESGDLTGTPGIALAGPAGLVFLEQGVIVAMRHIHLSAEDALRYGFKDKQMVQVRLAGTRETIFGQTAVRVSALFATELHLDLDEANACGAKNGDIAEIKERWF